jgi:hypothetical protein
MSNTTYLDLLMHMITNELSTVTIEMNVTPAALRKGINAAIKDYDASNSILGMEILGKEASVTNSKGKSTITLMTPEERAAVVVGGRGKGKFAFTLVGKDNDSSRNPSSSLNGSSITKETTLPRSLGTPKEEQ